MDTNRDECDDCANCRQMQEQIAEEKASIALAEAELRQMIEQRMADGLDVERVLDDLSGAGVDVATLLFG